jgi:hypothetical protein
MLAWARVKRSQEQILTRSAAHFGSGEPNPLAQAMDRCSQEPCSERRATHLGSGELNPLAGARGGSSGELRPQKSSPQLDG